MNNLFSRARDKIWNVSELTSYIKSLLEGDAALFNVWLKGEVSDFKKAYSGHCYFKLKDQSALITCVMFKSRADKVSFDVKDGLKVLLRGSITVYEKGGNYQIIVDEMKPEGIGELYLQFLQLKEKLSALGYFSPERKRPVPFMPKGVGIATSLKGAGLQDMIRTIKKKFPATSIYISPTIVQGSEAADSIVKSINILNRLDTVEVIIVGRGGGSFEDLNCFNDKKVADAVYNSKKPVISGVGHETDFTICDMVADVRAETPTAAANLAVPMLADLQKVLFNYRARLARSLGNIVKNQKYRLSALKPEKMFKIVENKINQHRQNLDLLWEGIVKSIQKLITDTGIKLAHKLEKLNTLSPFRVLERGYAVVKDKETGKFITRATSAPPGKNIEIHFADSSVGAKITGKG